jgi:hypothetical protein
MKVAVSYWKTLCNMEIPTLSQMLLRGGWNIPPNGNFFECRFLPKTFEVLKKITIKSARTAYETIYPGKSIYLDD